MPQPHKKRTGERSPRSGRNVGSSPKGNRLYPNLDDTLSEDEDDESWEMSSPEDKTRSSLLSDTDNINSSFFEDSPVGLRSSRYASDSSFGSPLRLRSGKSYRGMYDSDFSDSQASFSRSPQSSKTKRTTGESGVSSSLIIGIIIGLLLLIIAAVTYYYLFLSHKDLPTNDTDPDVYDKFKQKLSVIKAKFPSQTAKSWQILNAATKHILTDPNPIYPAVILMVGSSQTLPVMTCISSKVISLVNTLYNTTDSNSDSAKIRVLELNRRSPELEKLDLDRRLHGIFSAGYKGAAVVNLESLSPVAALMLHSYCDNDNAPYKQVILFLQLTSGSFDLDESTPDRTVESYLRELWEAELGVDRQMALLSRIANNIMLVKPEEPGTVAAACG